MVHETIYYEMVCVCVRARTHKHVHVIIHVPLRFSCVVHYSSENSTLTFLETLFLLRYKSDK
jgi:hypothetical protein